jgi:hypothetical protein
MSETEPGRLSYEPLTNDPWLLFMRGYEERLPDWLAYNKKTAEVRRFANVRSEEVIEDLLGGNPAPGQENLLERWGKADAGQGIAEMIEAMKLAVDLPPDLANVLTGCDFPVYGLIGSPLRLVFNSFDYGGGGLPLERVTLSFVFPRPTSPERAVEIESGRRLYRVVFQEPEVKRHEIRSLANQVVVRYGARPDELWEADEQSEEQATNQELVGFTVRSGADPLTAADPPEELEADVSIPGFSGEVKLWKWETPEPICAFMAENDRVQLKIASYGLSDAELSEVIRNVSVISSQPDVIASYQAALDARFDRLREEYLPPESEP